MRILNSIRLTIAITLNFLFASIIAVSGQEKPALEKLSKTEQIEVLDRLAGTFLDDSVELSLEYRLRAYNAAKDYGNNDAIAEQSEKLADLYTQLGRYNKALEHYDISLGVAKRKGSTNNLIRLHRFIGNAYYYTGEYDKSLESLFISLEYARKINDEHGIASAYNNLGLIYMEKGEYSRAMENYHKAENLFSDNGLYVNQGMALVNIGNIYYFENDIDNALIYYTRALKTFEQSDQHAQIAIVSQNISIIYEEKDDIEEALKYGLKAYQLYTKSSDIFGLTNVTRNVGYLYLGLDSLDKAKGLFQKSLYYAKQTNSLSSLRDSYTALSDIYNEIGDYQLAFENLIAQNVIVDSIYRMETERKIADLEATHDLEKARKEHRLLQIFFITMSALAMLIVMILLFNNRIKVRVNRQLKEKNAKIEEQNTELAAINATKDKFFSIIAHDLKNPLAAFIGFMDVFQIKLSEMPPEEQKSNLKQVTLLAENMFDLLENLLKWGRSQIGSIDFNPEKLNAYQLAEKAISIVSWNAKAKSITINNNIDPSVNFVGDKNMLLTVLRNLVSNAVKFSPMSSTITISSDRKDDKISILVKDTGIGVSKEDQAKLFRIDSKFRNLGTSNETGTGLGLILCKEFIEKHNGKMIVHSQEGKGSVFGFTINNA